MNVDDLIMLTDLAKRMEIKDSALRAFLKKHAAIAPPKRLGRLCFTPAEALETETRYSRFIAGRCVFCGIHPMEGPNFPSNPAKDAPDAPAEPAPTEDTPEPADGVGGNAGGEE